jgi:hypothetical protein
VAEEESAGKTTAKTVGYCWKRKALVIELRAEHQHYSLVAPPTSSALSEHAGAPPSYT